MSRKRLTYEFVKSEFEKRRYTLLSNEYISSKVKLNCICPDGHEGSIRWNGFSTGYGCPHCAGKIN